MPLLNPGIQGWMSDEAMDWLLNQSRLMDSVLEVGSWKGLSTFALLSGCKGPVFAVDHFLGSSNQRDGAHKEATEKDIFQEFWQNVGHFRNLVVLRMESTRAALYFAPKSIDMIFIDGCHLYEAVLADVQAWLPKCKRLFCGHDLGEGGVRKALEDSGLVISETSGGIWRFDVTS